jgi:hypothetical protein
MRKIIIFVGIIILFCVLSPIQAKALGFNEVPWVAYTIVDAAEPYYDSVSGQGGYSNYNVSVNMPDSMENYCVMHTYAYGYHSGGSGKGPIPSTNIEAGVTKTNFSVTAPFIVKIFSYGKADLYHWTSSQMNKGSAISEANVLFYIDGAWETRWADYYLDPFLPPYSSHPTHYYGGNMSFPITSGNLTGMKINGISRVCTAGSSYSNCEAGATNDFRIDSVTVENVGIEEKRFSPPEADQNDKMSINPNLFAGKAVIIYELLNEGKIQLKIYDITGKCVKTLVDRNILPGSYKETIESKDYVKGVYFVKFLSENYRETKKIIVIK